ncbi:sensor histidine kinase [Methylobacterium sp. WSM2598]|uniref:sensor histidine kinase n=1 Tax=Methylobacterium sp. WSM2598 TaxID=398261 RepID=UPI000381FE5F|nr:HWE histidine kinase domain-containing protein [Methylobacterium sp. WSM2598]
MTTAEDLLSERALILAPIGRDAALAQALLAEAGIRAISCSHLHQLPGMISEGAGLVIIAEEALREGDLSPISRFVAGQPPWSDLPFVLLTRHGGGAERTARALWLSEVLGNVIFLERPFHPTTLVSVVRTALRGRRRQYEARAHLEELCESAGKLKEALAAERRSAQHQRLLLNELNHRVKNTLATVQSIGSQTLRNAATTMEAQEALETRLLALSRAHDVLMRESWEGADLSEIVTQAIAPYDQGSNRFRAIGPEVRLSPHMALALSMAFQELSTNAVKYGALSNGVGSITIAWSVINDAEPPRLVLRWVEQGGPAVVVPRRRGFGSRLIERNLARDLDGSVEIAFITSGVTCTVDAPLA